MDMQIIYNYLLIIVFFIINIFISYYDIKYKKIKNNHLLLLIVLLPLFYYNFHFQYTYYFFIQYFILFFVLAILFYNSILPWGDFKYILVLSLFAYDKIPFFIWNLSFIVIFRFLISYIIFLFGRLLEFRIWLIKTYFNNILKNIPNFSLRFINSYFFVNIVFYFIFLLWFSNFFDWNTILHTFLIVSFIYILKKIYSNFLSKFNKNSNKVISIIDNYMNYIVFIILGWYYCFLLLNNEIMFSLNNLYSFLVIYIFVFFISKSLMLMINQNEEMFIDIKDLRAGNYVDRSFLKTVFWQYDSIIKYLKNDWVIRWDVFFDKFENPITEELRERIVRIFNLVNKKNLEEKNWYTYLDRIKVFKTFSFWPYIFLAFFTLVFLGINIFGLIIFFYKW